MFNEYVPVGILLSCIVVLLTVVYGGGLGSPRVHVVILWFYIYGSDFLIRGHDDPWIALVPAARLADYQLYIGLTFIPVAGAAFLLLPSKSIFARSPTDRVAISARNSLIVMAGLALIFGFELYFRLSASGWGLAGMLADAFGSRLQTARSLYLIEGQAPLAVLVGQLFAALPPLAIIFASVSRGPTKVVLIFVAVCSLALLFGNGSRTPIAVAGVTFWACWIYRVQNPLRRFVISAVLTTVLFITFSLQYSFRASGMASAFDQPLAAESLFTYHQDNNYYMSLYGMFVADNNEQRVDAASFFSIALLNPVPSSWWPNKPKVDDSLFGIYRPYWYTVGILGELVSVYGTRSGVLLSCIAPFFLFLMLRLASRRTDTLLDVMQYIVILMYTYMIMRSILNFSQWIYVPAAFLAVQLIVRARTPRVVKRRVQSGKPEVEVDSRNAIGTQYLTQIRPRKN